MFLLVCCKLLCASAEPYVYEAVTVTFDCGGHSFTAKGKRILSEGWREIDRIFRASLKERPADGDGGTLPDINLTENLDCYEIYPNIEDYDDLGRYYLEELDVMQVPEHLQNYIDYEAYGRDVALEENGTFTDQGYVRDTGDSFHEYYDGERGSIPDEYRVMTFQDDLPEEEKIRVGYGYRL